MLYPLWVLRSAEVHTLPLRLALVWVKQQTSQPFSQLQIQMRKWHVFWTVFISLRQLKIEISLSSRLCSWLPHTQVPSSVRRAVLPWLLWHITCFYANSAGCSFRLVVHSLPTAASNDSGSLSGLSAWCSPYWRRNNPNIAITPFPGCKWKNV